MEDVLRRELVGLRAVPVDDATDGAGRDPRGCWPTSSPRGPTRPRGRGTRGRSPSSPASRLMTASMDRPTVASARAIAAPSEVIVAARSSTHRARRSALEPVKAVATWSPSMAPSAASSAAVQPGSSGPGRSSGRPAKAVSTTNRQPPASPSDTTVGSRVRQVPRSSMAWMARCAAAARSRLARPDSARATLTMSPAPLRVRNRKAEMPPPPCDARSTDQPSADPGTDAIAAGTTDLASDRAERRSAARRTASTARERRGRRAARGPRIDTGVGLQGGGPRPPGRRRGW